VSAASRNAEKTTREREPEMLNEHPERGAEGAKSKDAVQAE